MQNLEATPNLLSQTLHFSRVPERFIYTSKLEDRLCTILCEIFLFSQIIRIKLTLDNQKQNNRHKNKLRGTGIFGGREETPSWGPYLTCFLFCTGSKC